VTLVANDAFVLGRPKVDEVEIRFVPNTNALAAHILAGSIDMTLEQDTLSADTVSQMLSSGWPGRAVQHMDDPIGAWPQFMDPSPRVILEVPFRRALVHALDRQLMADNLQYGLTQVAHTPVWPDDPMFKYAESRVVKYGYDQRRAVELIQGLGYARGSDGMFRDASGQPLRVELRATPGHELSAKSTLVAADMWQAVGVGVDTVMIPPALNNDAEYRQTRTGFEVAGMKYDLNRFTTAQVPTAENRYTGSNRSRYTSPAMDEMADRFFVTIPEAERGEIAAQAYYHISDQVVMLNFFYEAQQGVRANRLINVTGSSPVGWNAHEWDIALH
jgi:peptide/nickel transport system substrate-binding protein